MDGEKGDPSMKLIVAILALTFTPALAQTAFVPIHPPAMHAQTSAQPPAAKNPPTPANSSPSAVPPLDAISVKPDSSGSGRARLLYTADGVSATNVTVYMLLKEAYDLNDDQIVDAPAWAKTDRFDIEGKVTGPEAAQVAGVAHDEQRTYYQQLLTARFGLITHRETRDLPEYALTIGKSGSRLQESNTGSNAQAQKPPVPMFRMRADKDGKKIEASNASLAPFLNLLSNEVGRTVIDRTGLKDRYDFTLSWSPEIPSNSPSLEAQTPTGAAPANPGLFTAIQEQLGLKLEPVKGSIEVLVIDHIKKPSEN